MTEPLKLDGQNDVSLEQLDAVEKPAEPGVVKSAVDATHNAVERIEQARLAREDLLAYAAKVEGTEDVTAYAFGPQLTKLLQRNAFEERFVFTALQARQYAAVLQEMIDGNISCDRADGIRLNDFMRDTRHEPSMQRSSIGRDPGGEKAIVLTPEELQALGGWLMYVDAKGGRQVIALEDIDDEEHPEKSGLAVVLPREMGDDIQPADEAGEAQKQKLSAAVKELRALALEHDVEAPLTHGKFVELFGDTEIELTRADMLLHLDGFLNVRYDMFGDPQNTFIMFDAIKPGTTLTLRAEELAD